MTATAIVAGGAGGIGAAIGFALREDGWKVILANKSNTLEKIARAREVDARHIVAT